MIKSRLDPNNIIANRLSRPKVNDVPREGRSTLTPKGIVKVRLGIRTGLLLPRDLLLLSGEVKKVGVATRRGRRDNELILLRLEHDTLPIKEGNNHALLLRDTTNGEERMRDVIEIVLTGIPRKGQIQKIRVLGDHMVILPTGMRINEGPPTTGMRINIITAGVVPRRIQQGGEEMIPMGINREDH